MWTTQQSEVNLPSFWSQGNHAQSYPSRKRSSYDRVSVASGSPWMTLVVYFIALTSYVSHRGSFRNSQQIIQAYEEEKAMYHTQNADSLRRLSNFKRTSVNFSKALSKLRNIQAALGVDQPKPRRPNKAALKDDELETLLTKHVNDKTSRLEKRVETMTQYIQRISKAAVTERFGSGPHRVKFTVEFEHPRQESVYQSFIVQLASLDHMPHSVYLFLDMVESKIWDDTVFLHHEQVDHVIAAAPMDYKTHQIKYAGLHKLSWDALGFPEYHDAHPHTKYTLGFADRGPTFYINTLDNSKDHGPGGQGHHTLKTDADPCFASVVEGQNVVDSLVQMGTLHSKMTSDKLNPWADNEHTWTHVVSVEIV